MLIRGAGVAVGAGAVVVVSALAAIAARVRRGSRLAVVATLVFAGLVAAPPARVAAASGTTLWVQQFNNNTVNSAYPVSIPSPPSGGASSNSACLTASGSTSTTSLASCGSNNDTQGSGTLRLTSAAGGQEGGVFAAASVPTSQGIDATFNTYQYGGSGADGIAFVLAAVNPSDPVAPASIGQTGGALGYSANAGSSLVGLADAYMGIGLDVYGNFSNNAYEGTGCTDPKYISTTGHTVSGQVVVRGPGNGLVGYCAINSTATSTSSKALTLRASTRAASVVPVEVAINPTTTSFTTASGITVPAGSYAVQFTPVGGSATTETGTLPSVASGLYPSSSWTTSAGIPKQLAFGFVGSTGAVTDYHEISNVNVVSFSPVPQLAVSQTSYVAASPAAGTPVTYTVSPSISSSGASESNTVSVAETLPTGVVPVGAYGSGWTCGSPSGQTITCTDSATPFAAGTSLPAITVEGIVTSSSVTASTIQSGTTVTASSSDGNPGIATSTTAGTLPAYPAGVTLSPATGTISGGNTVTISGSNITAATAIEIGTTAQQQAGTPTVLLPCPTGVTSGCFTVSGSTLSIPSMPSVTASETATVTVVTLGAYGSPSYVYTSTPGTPAAPTATAGITSASVTWTAPAANGSPITGYVVTPYLNGTAQTAQAFSSTATTQTLTGLTAGGSYTFTVAAVNAVGTGSASPQSNAVVPYTLPGAPTITAVGAADSAASLSWSAPASNGGSAITGYVVTPYIAGVAQAPQTFSSTATTHTVAGLTPGTSYTFTVAAVNAAGTGPASARSSAVTVNAGPSLTFAAPPAGEVGVAYSDQLTSSGGTGALAWSVSSGSLPGGLSLNSSTGLLSGTPTASGSFSFTVTITDAAGGTASKAVTVTIAAAPSLANPAPPSGQAGVAYSDALAVTGGTGPFTWSVSSGSLPAGVTLNSSTGALSGTPTTAGLYSFTVQVTDADGQTATQGLNLTVAVGPIVIATSASTGTATQGGRVGFTVTVTNTAATAYSGVTYSMPLGNMVDDAAYNGDAAATAGTVSVSGQTLTWTGNLAAGAAATVTFSLTVNNPYTGNGTLAATVTSSTVGTNCASGSTDTRCTISVAVAALTIAATSTVTSAAPGSVVPVTVTVTNTGVTTYTGATFTDPLTGMLDDAVYNGNAAASTGTVSYTSPNLTWTGNLAAGATATITFSVTVNNPDTGNKILTGTITSGTTGSNCFSGSTDSRCTLTVNVQGLTIANTASTSTTTPGSVVSYTVTVTNSGQASYGAATITDPLAGVLTDATYNGDATATSGSLSYTSPNLTWTGSLAAGATATITFSVTVNNPDTGTKTLTTTVTSSSPAANCPVGGTAAACTSTVSVLTPGLTIVTSAGVSSTTPGSRVGYTVTVTDTGQTIYTGVSVSIPLSGVLDDAAYNGDAAATSGTVSYANPTLTWTGNLALGGVATITYSVTVNNPDTGNKLLATTVTSAAAGSNCASGSTDTRCSTSVPVLVPGLTLSVTANTASTTAGSVVQYTVVANNTGQTPDTGVSFTDSLSGVLGDATYNGNAAATVGAVSYTSPNLSWTGTLAAGATATITYSVTVNNPDTGGKILTSTVTSSALGSNCPSGGTASACSSTVTVSSLMITNTANVASATPGSVVRFTATFVNTGQTPYSGITVSDNAADVFDDAVPNGDQTASSGTLVVSGTTVTWTGSIPVGGTVTVTGTVTVNNPDTGNHVLAGTITTAAAGSNCPSSAPAAACSVSIPVLTPGLTISNTPSTTAAQPGSVVGYTLSITDSGQTPYTGITVTDNLSGITDDASYNGDAAVTVGAVSYASPVLTWTGNLAVGATATVTFSVTVNNPDTGDKLLIVTAASPAAGSACPSGTTTAPCRSTVAVLTPGLTITSTAGASTTVPGATVAYTVTITDTGQISYTGISVADSLSGLLDDAVYNGDAAASAGTVSYTSPNLTWTGSLASGGSATVTFSVTVNNPDTGNRVLTTAVTSAAAGSNCASGSTDPNCATSVPVESAALLTFQVSSGGASMVAGGVVHYTVTATNAAAIPYVGATFTDSLSGILDDATYNGDAAASTGTLAYVSPALTWTGTMPANGTATITFSVTVNNPDTGNKILATALTSASLGSNCPVGNTDPACSSTVTVSSLTITNTSSVASATPGGVVRFTATFANTGQTPYNDITVSDNAADVFDDAVADGDQAASSGTLVINGNAVVWTGSIPVGGTVTVTGTVTVNSPDAGNQVLAGTITTAAAGSNCPSSGPAAACSVSVPVLTPGLTITNTPSAVTTTPGSTIGYTLAITDSGQTSYTGISVTDDLSGFTDDAVYNGDAAASAGTVSYASPVLTWTGSLTPGQSATVTFSVTVNNPDTGDKLLIVTAASPAAGSSCPAGTTTAPCRSTAAVLTPGLEITSTAGASTTVPGATVAYTVTITDTGQTSYTGISVADSLSGLLDDAVYNGDAAASAGTVSYASPVLTWTGSLAVGGTATVTFSATVNNPDTGSKTLATLITSAASGSNCASGSTDPGCATTVPVSVLTITNSANATTTTPGTTVRYTVTVANTGQVSIGDAALTVPLTGVLGDAVYNGNAVTTEGIVSYASPDLSWTGDLAAGASATITYSVTVNNPDTGNKTLADTIISATPGSTCPASGSAPAACTATVTVLIPALTITSAASAAATTPGSVVDYTITVADTGQTSYTGATVTVDLTSIEDDAVYDGDATASTGAVSYASPVLTWTGSLAPGGTATITFSATVNNPDTGDKQLSDTVVSTAPGSSCPPGTTDPECSTTVQDLIPALTITDTASPASTTPGSVVDYTITVADTGQTPYSGATVTDDLTGVLGNAAYNGDAAASTGTVSYTSPHLTWTGDLATGATATITYTVTVDDPDTGSGTLTDSVTSAAPGSTCPASGTGGSGCAVTVAIVAGPLSITAPSAVTLGAGAPGGAITGSFGDVQVTDDRGFGAGWTAAVSSTNFTTGNASPVETIPVGDATYTVGAPVATSGQATFTYAPPIQLSGNALGVVTADNVAGNTSVTWNPVIQVQVPSGAIGGTYTAVVTHSVSLPIQSG
jgi:large repetitive protein